MLIAISVVRPIQPERLVGRLARMASTSWPIIRSIVREIETIAAAFIWPNSSERTAIKERLDGRCQLSLELPLIRIGEQCQHRLADGDIIVFSDSFQVNLLK